MNKTFETPTPPRLDLRLPGGEATIEAAAGLAATEIELDGPSELVDDATIEQQGDTIRVEVKDRKGFFGLRDQNVWLRVRCPAGSALAVRTRSADVLARGELASVDAATASGDLAVEAVSGNAKFKSASGDIAFERVAGEVSANTASGDIVGGRVSGPFRANLVSGDLRLGDAAGNVLANTVSGDVRLESVGRGSVQVQAVSGDVEVGVRRGSTVHVDASTLSGDTRSELELDGAPAGPDEGPLVELRVKTVSGDIAVVRAAQEVQPQ